MSGKQRNSRLSQHPLLVFFFICIPCIGFPVLNFFFSDNPNKMGVWSFFFFIFLELLFLFWLIGQVLYAMARQTDTAKDVNQALAQIGRDAKADKAHIQMLLTASSLLAVTSLVTTAEGMKKFVFSEGTAAFAYLCSFAIQSILFIFGKSLLQHYFSIRFAPWSEVLRKVLIRGMIIFFCLCLLASSIFSWVFISTNAYSESKFTDGEAAIQLFLTDETDKLMAENEQQREDNFKRLIGGINDNIKPIVQNNLKEKQAAVIETIRKYANDFSPMEYTIPDISAVNDQIDRLLDLARNDITNLNVASTTVKSNIGEVYARFINRVKQYSDIKQNLDKLTAQPGEDSFDFQGWRATVSSDMALCQTVYDDINDNFDGAISNAVQVNGFLRDGNSIVNYLASFHTMADNAKMLRNTLENILTALNSVENGNTGASISATTPDSTNSTNSGNSMSLNGIINNIYLLSTQEDAQSKAKDLINQLTNLLDSSSEVAPASMAAIVNTTQQLQKYADNLKLQDLLNTFKRNRVSHTYHIFDPKSSESNTTNSTEASTAPTGSDNLAAITVTSEQWTNERTQDMLDFISYLGLLPNEASDTYEPSAVLQEAIHLQRRHLGKLTELEDAFNYLTSDYPVMSYFSAALALFLDLTAFLTGCLIFFLNALKPTNDSTKSKLRENTEEGK